VPKAYEHIETHTSI